MDTYQRQYREPPMEDWHYGGLEVDQRIQEGRDKQIDPSQPPPRLRKYDEDDDHGRYLNEKQMIYSHEIPQSTPTSATSESSMDSLGPETPKPKGIDKSVLPPLPPRDQRICGLRRRSFWVLFTVALLLIVAAAVVGGVVGGMRRTASSGSSTNSTTTSSAPAALPSSSSSPPVARIPVQPADVMAGSPLNVISYDMGGAGDPQSRQGFRIYYQSVLGNIKEAVSKGLGTWTSATPIFTDAVNNTGLATVTYKNGTAQTGQMFYVSSNGLLQEKRKAFDDPLFWEPGSLNSQNIAVVSNISPPDNNASDPINTFNNYRMAAVYSDHFPTGPGTRLFHHMKSLNGSSWVHWVQEWIWTRDDDNWQKGQSIDNVYPNSHLAVTVDEQNKLLRLYYSIGKLTLQEKCIDIANATSTYNDGVTLNHLPANDVDLAATSCNGTVFLYHSSNDGAYAFRETIIVGTPYMPNGAGNQNSQESYNQTILPSRPSLASASDASPQQPLGASITIDGLDPQLFVFWADSVTGENEAGNGSASGYRQLSESNRAAINGSWQNATQVTIPLGNTNTYPSSTKRRSLGSLMQWLVR